MGAMIPESVISCSVRKCPLIRPPLESKQTHICPGLASSLQITLPFACNFLHPSLSLPSVQEKGLEVLGIMSLLFALTQWFSSRMILPPREHLAMSGNASDDHDGRGSPVLFASNGQRPGRS